MTIETFEKDEILSQIASVISQYTELLSSLKQEQFNQVPYEGSWTAGQLVRHVKKSISGMAQAMNKPAQPAERNVMERVEELKTIFLDYSKQLKSPEFIIPENIEYEKQGSIDELTKASQAFSESTKNANLSELVEGLPLGPITKVEIIHFVLYHTQRHFHQLQKIYNALTKNISS